MPRNAAFPHKPWRECIAIHPAAELFPLMSPDELRELGEDIKKNGLGLPIVIFAELMVPGEPDPSARHRYSLLDGRNRLDAMEAVGINFCLKRRVKDFGFVLRSDEVRLPNPACRRCRAP
jgi:hypothetical protein